MQVRSYWRLMGYSSQLSCSGQLFFWSFSPAHAPNPSFRVIVKLAQLLSFWSTEWNCEALGRLRWRQTFRCKGLRQWRGTFAAPILICASGVFFFCDWLVYWGCVSNFFAQSMYQYLVVSRRTLSRPFNALSTVAVWTSPAASHGDFLPAVWVQASEHIYICILLYYIYM
jgi:hypothetical protein